MCLGWKLAVLERFRVTVRLYGRRPGFQSFHPKEDLSVLVTNLARFIIRNMRAVVVIWLVALVLSIPAILQVQSVIVYNETAFNPKNSESSKAQNIVSNEFSIDQGNSVIVVITAADVRGNDVRDFSLALNRTLHNDGKLSNINNITSIYYIYSQLLLGYTSVIHLQLYQTKNVTTLASNIEFGIPSAYVIQWISLVNSGSGTIDQTQLAPYNSQAYTPTSPIASAQTPAAYQAIAFNYLTRFYKSWNQTFTATTYTPLHLFLGPFALSQNLTNRSPLFAPHPPYSNITLPFIQSIPLSPPTLGLFVSAARFFNIYSVGSGIGCSNNNCWNDQNAIRY